MNWSSRSWTWLAGLVMVAIALGSVSPSFGQADQSNDLQPPGANYRNLAPGVMIPTNPYLREADTVCRHDVVELATLDDKYDWAKDVAFRRTVWYLDFKFKPMRMIFVDVPQPDGRMKQKLIWYQVYSVTNPGKVMPSVKDAQGNYQLQDSTDSIRFAPEFHLKSLEYDKTYLDRVIPIAVGPIQMREDPNRKFLTSESIRDVKVGQTVWGIAMWEDVDSRIDRFSVYVNGLTNAYRWTDADYKKGDPIGKGRQWIRKTLKLNFWRPGDEYYEHEKEFHFGIPGEVDYEWVYR